MKFSFIVKCFLLACVIVGCKQPQKPAQLKDKIKSIELYDFVSISYQLKTAQGKVVETTYGFDARPRLMFVVQPYFNGDLHTALVKLREGDSTTVKVSVDSLAKYMYYQHDIADKGTYLTYALKINAVVKRAGLSDSLFNEAIENLKAKEVEVASQKENLKIKSFIKQRIKNYQKTANGIYYTYLKRGSGKLAKVGESVKLNYKFSLLDGQVFETNSNSANQKSHPFLLNIPDQSEVGFVQLAALLKPNERIYAIVPSALAYGKLGNKFVPPYAPIVMEIERL